MPNAPDDTAGDRDDAGSAAPSDHDSACPPAHRKFVLIASVLASSMAFIDGTAVTLALGPIQQDFGATLGDILWVHNSYTLFLAALILVGGALGDIVGRRLIFVVGIAIFTLASLACGLAPDSPSLIAARAVQGVGAALLTPMSLTLISVAYPKSERGKAIGAWAAASAIMTAVGPPLGGWLAENMSWRWIFYINIPIGAATIALTLWGTPESKGGTALRDIDWQGALLAVIGLGVFAYGLIVWADEGGSSTVWVGALVLGAAAMAAFVWRQFVAKAPMAPPDLFRSRCFSVINIMTFFLYGALGGVFVFYPITMREAYGHGVDLTGQAFLGFAITMGVLSRVAGGLIDKWGVRRMLTLGPMLASIGFAMMAFSPWSDTIWLGAFPAMIVFGAGMAITVPALSTAVFNAAPESQAGAASGVNNAVARAASLFAVAAFGVVAAAAFRASLAPGVEADFGAGSALFANGDAALASYRQAMIESFRAVVATSVVLGLISAALAITLLTNQAEGKRGLHEEMRWPHRIAVFARGLRADRRDGNR